MGIRGRSEPQYSGSGEFGLFWDWRHGPLPSNTFNCCVPKPRVAALRRILIGLILGYQRFAPAALRNRCIFAESCSNFVLRAIREKGVRAGAAALILRTRRCRPGYFRLAPSPLYHKIECPVCLADGSIVDIKDLSPRCLI
jgi:putative component of membrane protein insertase Oxa1/YidC/SpoIIIJ protein YidD